MTTISTYKSQLQRLRQEWKETTDPERRKTLRADAERLKSYYGCYECKEEERQPVESDLFPFCSLPCKTIWGERSYGKEKGGKQKRSIEDMQKTLKAWSEEMKVKKSMGKTERLL